MSRLRAAASALIRFARRPWARTGFLVLALVAAVWAVVSQWDGVVAGMSELSLPLALATMGVTIAYVWLTMRSWRSALNGLGDPVPSPTARTIFFVSQVAKYLPGGVWNFVAAAEMGADHQITRRRSVAAMAVSMLVTVATGLALACIMLWWGPQPLRETYGWLGWTFPVFVLLLTPWALNRLLRLLGRGSHGDPLRIPAGAIGRAVLWSIAAWLCAGTQVYLLAEAMGIAPGFENALLSVGGYALAWVAGFLFIIAPAGVGIREAALGVTLVGALPEGAVVAVVLLSRVMLTLADLALGGVAAYAVRRRSRAHTGGS